MGDENIVLKKTKPRPEAVQNLMRLYPKLDYLLAETILSFSEEELGEFLSEKKKSSESIDDVGEIES